MRDPNTPSSADQPPAAASPYWGDEAIWNSQTTVHSFAMDKQGRVWAAARVRKAETPAWCRAGSDHPSAKLFPINQSQRGLEMYDPKTKQLTTIDTCFSWGHVNFDDNDVLWSSFGPAGVEGWFDVKIWDKTHDEKQAQGWSAFVLDNNGNGKRDAYTEPNQPADPTKDRRLNVQYYGDSPAFDGSVWGTVQGMPGALVRFVPGAHPPETALTEYYEVPWNRPNASSAGICAARHGRRQQERRVDGAVERTARQLRSQQVQGPAQRSDGHRTALPRRLDAVSACPDRTTKARSKTPAPIRRTTTSSIASTCSASARTCRSRPATCRKDCSRSWTARFMMFRVPYPMGFFAKGMDGRIDNPNGGWKGKGIFTTYATRAPFHVEGGKGTTSKLVKFQVRPDPLGEITREPDYSFVKSGARFSANAANASLASAEAS